MQTAAVLSYEAALKRFEEIDEKITHLTSISSLLGWDQKVMAPKKGRGFFSKSIGTLETEIFKLQVSGELGEVLAILDDKEKAAQLDERMQARIRERKMFYDKSKSIPADMYKEYSILTADANNAWEEAREKNDFLHYLPYLEKIIDYKKQFIKFYGEYEHPYDALLEDFEPGLTVKKLDPLFSSLRKSSVKLLKKIQNSGANLPVEIVKQSFPVGKQKDFNRRILPEIGFDLDAGRLDETVHPFAQPINTRDVRITTRYAEYNVLTALFGTIHEAGHGIYEQQIDPALEGTCLREGASFGIHESQSRFLENMVGRSRQFWSRFYPEFQKTFPEQLANVTEDQFYQAINAVNPSFIRVEADELTYNLHIMLRYEIEKSLFEGTLSAKELPEAWNKKMEDYLGITPETDTAGVLQDVHWSFGGFGYFPSYSLGNLYAAQILAAIKKQIPDFGEKIAEGDFSTIMQWLKENIHQYGKTFTPDVLIQKVTGEELNAEYLIQYLEDKYGKLYNC
ncbi:carboxypeptidase M32 [Bacillus infantis]|uniref:carboxypeptidase M32 n=1 Tax=Bacillus infantis TaxID=324767 RepID=UPI002155C5D1|nr:carboxypeptidase M32 [Bacillus infantis]MCR6611450.1 carboxypeptidase M32 [Bacillus infantis]